ncbi:MAG TPA: pilus assembly protein TadG-related protein [Dehalococcoidia bacterium]|nr:pilus assembly protein TadG-related protein [Dehalococcoidia bacterium]
MKTDRHASEKGQVLIVAVMAMGVLMGMVALVTDAGMLLHERRSLQNAADAAALAGAKELPASPELAASRARAWAASNGIADPDTLVVQITTTYATNDTISVRASRDVKYRFANVLGISGATVGASAAARAGSPAGLDRFIPFAVENQTLSGLNPGDAATIKYDSQTQTNGNSLALAFPGSSGGADFRNGIYNGSAQAFCVAGHEYPGCTSTISTEPGAMVGPTQQGIRDLLNATSTACDDFSEVFKPDPANPSNMLITQSCNPFPPYNVATSKKVIIIPVIAGLCGGRCDVQIVRFALFFVNGVHCNGGQGSCQVTGQYAEASFDAGQLRMAPYSGDAAFTLVRLVE